MDCLITGAEGGGATINERGIEQMSISENSVAASQHLEPNSNNTDDVQQMETDSAMIPLGRLPGFSNFNNNSTWRRMQTNFLLRFLRVVIDPKTPDFNNSGQAHIEQLI